MAYTFVSVKTLYRVEEVTGASVPDKVNWAKSIILNKAAAIDV